MKFIIETTEHGYTETLEAGGRVFRKRQVKTDTGFRACDKEFCEQLEAEGIHDEVILDDIYEAVDDLFLGMDLWRLEGRLDALLRAVGNKEGKP